MKHVHHIIPKHMGGTDDPDNLISLTPDEHAEAHRLLYEKFGHWQDKVAWIGLACLSTREEHVHLLLSEAGKKGASISNQNGGWRQNNPEAASVFKQTHSESMRKFHADRAKAGIPNPAAKLYEITHPNGDSERVIGLKPWCDMHGLKFNTVYNMCVAKGKTHKGYRVSKVSL